MRKSAARHPFVQLDARGGGPLQTQIYTAVRRAVLDGVLRPGARLLSSRALADDLGVSRTTTLLACEQLIAEGYLVTRRRAGTFVADELPDDAPDRELSGLTDEARRRSPRAGTEARTDRQPVAAGPSKASHPPISRRGALMAASPPIVQRVPGPPRAFRLGVPALDLFPIRVWGQLVQRRVRALTMAQLDYADAMGMPALREAIADHVRQARGTVCTTDQVVIVAGAQRGLDLICRLLLDPGDVAWMEDPCYPGARAALVNAGARVLTAQVDDDGVDVEAIRRRRVAARLAYVTPSHQFPLGVHMSLPRRLALLRWASASRAWVIEDDYDSEFRYHTRPMPCMHGLDTDGRVIYVGSFSKTLFPALRLGFLIVPADLHDMVRAARRGTDLHTPALDQAVLADLMIEGHYERHLRRMRAAYRERLEALQAAAERFCGGVLRMRPVRTGLHAVAELEDAGIDATRVCQEAVRRGVEIMPLAAYTFARRPAINGLVLGFGAVRPDALTRGMAQVAAAIETVRSLG